MASLASDGIPMEESSVEETRGINVAEGIDKLENTRVSDIFDEGNDVNCERYLMESGENYSKPLEEHEQKNGLKDVDLKETSREEEDKKSNSLNVFDDVIISQDIPNGETTDIHFENGEGSQHLGEKRDENEQEDSLDNEEALKMPQNEHRNELDESDSRSMQDLVPENSSKEFISEDCCEDDHLHQSDKIEERGEIEDVQVIESMEGKGTVKVEDKAMGLPIHDYEIEPPAVVKHLEPEEIVDPKSLESTVSETQNAIKEYVFQSEPETKSSPLQTDNPSFETKSNEYDEEKIHVDTEASLDESMEGKGTVQVEDNAMGLPIQDYEIEPPAVVKHLEPEEIVDPKSLESTVSETQNAIKENVFQSEPETKSSPMQTDTPSFETKSIEYDEEKIHVDTEASLEFSSTLVSESSFLEPEEIVDNKSLEGTVSETQNAIEKDIFHHEPESTSSPMQTDTLRFETKSNEYDGEKIHVDTEVGPEFSSLLESESCSLEPEEIVDQKSLESTASETQNAEEEDIFHHEPESKFLQMQTDTPSYDAKSNEYDGEKIHVDTEASLESSSMLESESFSVELEKIVDQKSLQITALETQNVVEEDIFHCEPETKSLVMQTDTSSFETKSNEFDAEKIHIDTDASLVFSESSSPFRYVEDSNSGPNRGHDPKQKFEDSDMGLEFFSSNNLSISTDNEDFIAESTEDDSYITAKSDTFSLLRNENNSLTESQSTEDAKFVSRNDKEIDDFDRTTIDRDALIDQILEMHNAEAKNEKDLECEATDRDVNLVEENGEDANEAEDLDSNANTWPEECGEQSLSLQTNTDLVSAIVADTEASLVFSSMLSSESSSPFKYVEDSNSGTFLTHRDQESQDLQTIEGDNEASTLLREKGFEALRMDDGLTENILVPDQWNGEKLQLQANEVMAKTTSEMLPINNFSEPNGAIAQEQFTIPTTEIPKNSSPTSSFGTFLTHRGQESQDLQTIEGDNEASTLLREKALKIDATKRASVWDCCGFWNWLHAHED